ncbi:MAG: UDP-N-acetylmuramoyl-L-alanine--D-glutamate ligase [Neomegalonema sp.]|nr:UDP-N-acetylmuramoyl-L-alanine--D-glutamate ligase [Neomegalonema sp.]
MIPIPLYCGQRVGVLGLGRSGLASARALAAGGAEVVAWDDGEAGRTGAVAEGFSLADLRAPAEIARCAALIVSPGIGHLYPSAHPAIEAAWAAGVPVDNDAGLFFAALPDGVSVIAVTGSNGKSTTAALTHHLAVEAGFRAHLGGNIGRGMLDLDPPRPGDVVVLELSSYQTDLARCLRPRVGVLTNLSPDHLDRHDGLGGYFAAKRRLFEIWPPELAVIGADEREGRSLGNALLGRAGRVAMIEGDTLSEEARLTVTGKTGAALDFDLSRALSLKGRHNRQNAACALTALLALGAEPAALQAGLESFGGLRHRMQRIGEAGGVVFVNDSKATNAEAAEKALLAFDRIRWILGGVPKAGGIAMLAPLLPKVRKAYLIGEAAEAFASQLGATPYEHCGTLAAALSAAAAQAEPGETVLLSPACASFDQFASFEARGAMFEDLVRDVVNRAS